MLILANRQNVRLGKFWLISQFYQHFKQAFLYESNLCCFSLITVWLWFFGQNNIGAKAACKMLMKLHYEIDLSSISTCWFFIRFLLLKNANTSCKCIKVAHNTFTLNYGFYNDKIKLADYLNINTAYLLIVEAEVKPFWESFDDVAVPEVHFDFNEIFLFGILGHHGKDHEWP